MENKAIEIITLVRKYAHNYWAEDQACSEEEHDECESEMVRIEAEIINRISALELDAQRYRKLKELSEGPDDWDGFFWLRGKFDEAVDALPEPK